MALGEGKVADQKNLFGSGGSGESDIMEEKPKNILEAKKYNIPRSSVRIYNEKREEYMKEYIYLTRGAVFPKELEIEKHEIPIMYEFIDKMLRLEYGPLKQWQLQRVNSAGYGREVRYEWGFWICFIGFLLIISSIKASPIEKTRDYLRGN